jgi:hypothetical protein
MAWLESQQLFIMLRLTPVRRGMIGGSSSVDWYLATHAGLSTAAFT